MSTALQRLLTRRSSLILLRRLVQIPALEEASQKSLKLPCGSTRRLERPLNTNAIVNALDTQESSAGVPTRAGTTITVHDPPPHDWNERKSSAPRKSLTKIPQGTALESRIPEVLWEERLQSAEDLEFESDVGGCTHGRQRLVDGPEFSNDAALWAYLLTVRMRRHGVNGVAMFWNVIRQRNLQLPTEGPHAETLWAAILDLGLTQRPTLNKICHYADGLHQITGHSWEKFYAYIMQHKIMNDGREVISHWHERLIRHHTPGPDVFATLVRNIIYMKGDLKALKIVYERHDHRKLYGEIVPTLLESDDFHGAFQWHFILLRHGDLPLSQKVVEPLISYFTIYDAKKAQRLVDSLVDAGVPFVDSLTKIRVQTTEISREMMNLIHGAAFNIKPKEYSDGLGSRWFATGWISLDLAINTVHALGVEEIGPLSLQAIALREQSATGVVQRLNQLAELGISIGSSTFSKAVESFARNGETEFLEGLLASDQHPDELEDFEVQESLLQYYTRVGDWAQYRRTEAILRIWPGNSRTEQHNIDIRRHVSAQNLPAVLQKIEEMRIESVAITQQTFHWILRRILNPRRPGHNLNSSLQNLENIRMAISILRSIVKSQGSVPVTSWQEILRRLGKLGRLDDIDELCLWLVNWYKPNSNFATVAPPDASIHKQRPGLVPAQVPLYHTLHPLRLLFSDSLQQAIVEWGFKNTPLTEPDSSPASNSLEVISAVGSYDWTRGLRLLRRLHQEGIFIKEAAVRLALMNRLTILYGPGESNVVRNRRLKMQNTLSLDETVQKINEAWGREIFHGTAEIEEGILSRFRSSTKRQQERKTGFKI